MPPMSAAAMAALKAKAVMKATIKNESEKDSSDTSLMVDKLPQAKEIAGDFEVLVLLNG